MSPDDDSKVAAEPAQPMPGKGRRRSRRGGRRHSRRRGSRPPGEFAGGGPAGVAPQESFAPAAETEVERAPAAEAAPAGSAVSQAIDQVTQVIEELKRALEEMELVLETLEVAERQKIDDEREIESLQRALRQLHRSSSGPAHRH